MAKFKVGDRVRLLGNCYAGEGTEPGNIGTIIPYIGHRGGYQVRLKNYPEGLGFYECELELIGGTMNVGDLLVNEAGYVCKVLAVCGDLYGLSENNDPDAFDCWLTQKQLDEYGWKLKTGETVEKSVAEIEKDLGLASGTLRVKKDN